MHGFTFDIYADSLAPAYERGVGKLADSIRAALLTPKGTRPNLPKFGSRLHLLQFELINSYLIDQIHACVQEAITDSLEGVRVAGINYEVSYDRRAVTVHVDFIDAANGLAGRSSVAFANGEFS